MKTLICLLTLALIVNFTFMNARGDPERGFSPTKSIEKVDLSVEITYDLDIYEYSYDVQYGELPYYIVTADVSSNVIEQQATHSYGTYMSGTIRECEKCDIIITDCLKFGTIKTNHYPLTNQAINCDVQTTMLSLYNVF